MSTQCEHGVATNEDCAACRALLDHRGLMGMYMALKDECAGKDAQIARLTQELIQKDLVIQQLEGVILSDESAPEEGLAPSHGERKP